MKQLTMQLLSMILLVKLIQCEINTTINSVFPSIIIQSYQDLPLTEQAIYDLKNTMRKSDEINDFDDDEDYNEDDQIEFDYQLIPSIESTTSKIGSNARKSSSSSCFVSKFIYLLLLVVVFLTQTNK